MRKNSEVEVAGPVHSMLRMVRWVERRGCVVHFGNVVGPYCGRPYVYSFTTEAKAIEFAEFVGQKDAGGSPVEVPLDHWSRPFEVKGP